MSRGSVTAATSTYRASALLRDAILAAASWRLDQPVERLSIGASAILVDGQESAVLLAHLAAGEPSDNGGHVPDASVPYATVQPSHPSATTAFPVAADPATRPPHIVRSL